MECFKPFMNKGILTPCGACEVCRKTAIEQWAFRIENEDRYALSSFFITLTYETDHVPITNNGWLTIQKSHLQAFMKRLRHKNKAKLKYYACGEYGEWKKRPHYHLILFNLEGNEVQVLRKVENAWPYGTVQIGTVNGGSIRYCLKYMQKKSTIPVSVKDDREKEFKLVSKGMGINYASEKMEIWHRDDKENRWFVTNQKGKKVAIPRYYKDKMFTQKERDDVRIDTTLKRIEENERIPVQKKLKIVRDISELRILKQSKNNEKSIKTINEDGEIRELPKWKR